MNNADLLTILIPCLFAVAGLALGLGLAVYQDRLVAFTLPKEYRNTALKKKSVKIIFALVCALLSLASALLFKDYVLIAANNALLCIVLCNVFAVDYCHSIIFDRFQVILAFLGLIESILESIYDTGYKLSSHVIGLFLGGFFFLAVALIGQKIYRAEVLGGGDIKLAFSTGFFLGWQRFVLAMLIATVSGSIILLIIRKKRGDAKDTEYPFAPFIAVGAAIAALLGSRIIEMYVKLYNF